MKFMPMHIQLYILFILNIFLSLGTNYDKILLLPLALCITYTIYTISIINKEFMLVNNLIQLIKLDKIKGRFKTTNFNFIDFRELVSHLNDIVDVHLKTIEKAKYYNQSKKEKESLIKNINIDDLTGLYKRNKFLYELEQSFRKCFLTQDDNLFVAFLDIDKFKNINDGFGHDVGDEVLVSFSELIKLHFKKSKVSEDIFPCRWGGEEFIVMIHGLSLPEVKDKLENFRRNVEQHFFPKVNKVTVSIGFSQVHLNEQETIESLIKRSDQGVYLSKENGRNQINFVSTIIAS